MQGKKTRRITVRFDQEEAKKLLAAAAERNMTPSAYLRMMAFQSPRTYPEIRVLLRALINEINHIGVNINQIVKNHNSFLYSKTDKERLFAYMKKLNLLTKEVVDTIGNQ